LTLWDIKENDDDVTHGDKRLQNEWLGRTKDGMDGECYTANGL